MKEEELIKVAAYGDVDAFRELVNSHIHAVHRFLVRYMGSAEDAEDVTQDTFIRVWNTLRSFDTSKPFRPWLFRIARNIGTDLLRRRKALPFTASQDESFEETLVDPEPLPDEVFALRELGTFVQRALSILPPQDRLVLMLHYVEGFSFEEIADITALNSSTVRSIHHRALKKMRGAMLDATNPV